MVFGLYYIFFMILLITLTYISPFQIPVCLSDISYLPHRGFMMNSQPISIHYFRQVGFWVEHVLGIWMHNWVHIYFSDIIIISDVRTEKKFCILSKNICIEYWCKMTYFLIICFVKNRWKFEASKIFSVSTVHVKKILQEIWLKNRQN